MSTCLKYLLFLCSMLQYFGVKGSAANHLFESKINGHEYELILSIPDSISPETELAQVVYLDAGLHLGEYCRAELAQQNHGAYSAYIGVGIKQIGDFHQTRRRDFIPSRPWTLRSSDMGQADLFYHVLKDEILPFIDSIYPATYSYKKIIGHSLSAAFVTYMWMMNDCLFDYHCAFSPSLWVQGEYLKDSLQRFYSTDPPRAHLWLQYGGNERFNRIASSNLRFYKKTIELGISQKVYLRKIKFKGHNAYLQKEVSNQINPVWNRKTGSVYHRPHPCRFPSILGG